MADPFFDAGYDHSGRLVAEDRAGDNAPPLSVSELSLDY
jgi:exodeoxyribonuclease VII large subunit